MYVSQSPQPPRRSFLKAAPALTCGTVIPKAALRAQPLSKIDGKFMITPQQALEWNTFKSLGGPTYAGGAGWKRYTDFLTVKMREFGAGVSFRCVQGGTP
jgi:hypothetical protein